MAIGLPVKANYAAGDILTATNMNDLSGTFNNVATSYGQAAGKNAVINSAFQVAQRGTSISLAANTRSYTLDRWDALTNPSQACTISRQATGDTTNLPNIQYAARFQRNSGQTGTGVVYFAYSFETINSIPFAGKTVTFSFYARAGANYSSSGNALSASVATGTGTDQAILGGYTGTLTPITVNATLTTTWQRFSGTATLSSSLNEMCIYFNYAPTGTAGANDWFEVTGVQLEAGSIATPFQTASGGSIQSELAMCQRYYYRQGGAGVYQTVAFGMGVAGGVIQTKVIMPVTMRTVPTVLDYSTLIFFDQSNAGITATGLQIVSNQSSNQLAYLTSSVTTGTQYRAYDLAANNSTSAYLGLGAEL